MADRMGCCDRSAYVSWTYCGKSAVVVVAHRGYEDISTGVLLKLRGRVIADQQIRHGRLEGVMTDHRLCFSKSESVLMQLNGSVMNMLCRYC